MIPITTSMLTYALERKYKKLSKYLSIELNEPYIILHLNYLRRFIAFKASITLTPVEARGRLVTFMVTKIKPSYFCFIKYLPLQRSDFVKVRKGYIIIDFNKLDKINNLKYGSIKKLVVKKQVLWLKLDAK